MLWAADCAERVLSCFEKEYPEDRRPRNAIEVGRAWAHSDVPMVMREIRSTSLASHAAARQTDNAASRAAARAAGQAVATVHVAGHARAAAAYAIRAVEAEGIDPAKEREWQYRRLPKRLRVIAGI